MEKSIPFVETEATAYGKQVHKHFENRLVKKKALPLDLRHHEKVMARLYDAKGKGYGEQKLAINRNFEPTGYFDNDVWFRAILDYMKIYGQNAVVVDHKTGKMKDNFDQIELASAALLAHDPNIQHITALFYWTKDKIITKTKIHRSDLSEIWSKFLPRVEQLENAYETTNFPAKPNPLCKKYCGVKSCPHYGE